VLRTRSSGYLVQVESDSLDVHSFERLVDEGRSLLGRGLAAEASGRLRDALFALAGSGARGLLLRELRPGGNRPARGDPSRSARAPDRRRPRARAP
jgi:hypothetical protein